MDAGSGPQGESLNCSSCEVDIITKVQMKVCMVLTCGAFWHHDSYYRPGMSQPVRSRNELNIYLTMEKVFLQIITMKGKSKDKHNFQHCQNSRKPQRICKDSQCNKDCIYFHAEWQHPRYWINFNYI